MVFWLLVLIAAVLLWFVLSPAYKILGGFFVKLFDNAKREMSDQTHDGERKDELE